MVGAGTPRTFLAPRNLSTVCPVCWQNIDPGNLLSFWPGRNEVIHAACVPMVVGPW